MAAKWEKLLEEVRELRGKSNGLLFERVKRLIQVDADAEFRKFHKGDLAKCEDYLNSEMGDYGLSLYDAKGMIEEYPQKAQWEKGKLREMLATMIEKRKRTPTEEPTKHTRTPPVARAEYEQVVKDKQRQEVVAKSLDSRLKESQSQLDQLIEENRTLRQQLNAAKQRIAELESMVSGELAAT